MPSHAHTPVTGKKHPNRRHPHAGLVHDNTRHTARFTVIGNHLAQHPELSLLAIGLGTHIQSLPAGARVDIKTLAARFPEGTTRIAAALRELEAHGYLRRVRERVPGGRIITRTISCNHPGHRSTDALAQPRESGRGRPAASASRPYRTRPTPHPPSSDRPRTSSQASTARTPASCSPPATSPTSPPVSPPGWNATSPPQPYATP
ncbi:hypothetical protein STAFG_6057 [Streptomyces afghaniensis 772]|uniref:Helix-turn-helix domain-containing protein n=1 Tax=Streptomyces afghaniensis 772 TaxID=1283301 RepID=S4NEV0_9ACTN|nr:hypothetical protein STAFG_6057 [Streptomyces afghaniensis 772]